MAARELIRAAGAVVWRPGRGGPEVVLIHRPRHPPDWSLPKGKVDADELAPAAAVREVWEETGLRVRLGIPLPDQHYEVGDGDKRPKLVSYWTARLRGTADLATFQANKEVDEVGWFALPEAARRLSYPHDVALVETFAQTPYDSDPFFLVRHAKARRRSAWAGDDSDRPLNAAGLRQAARLPPLLTAYGVRRVVSSDAVRCVDTVLPFVNAHRVQLRLDGALSQESARRGRIRALMRRALSGRGRLAFCSHRPVLPDIFAALGLEPMSISPAASVVLHRKQGEVVAVEHHPPP